MGRVERDPKTSLGRCGARRDGLVVVFWASLVVEAESPRVAVGPPVGREDVLRERYLTSALESTVPYSTVFLHTLPLFLISAHDITNNFVP